MMKHRTMNAASLLTCVISAVLLMAFPGGAFATIDAVFFAQTHVQQPDEQFFKLVGNRATLLKVHVIGPDNPVAPPVSALLSLDGKTKTLTLEGPATLPAAISIEPGVAVHRFADSFTAMIPKEWIRSGLKVTVMAGDEKVVFDHLKIGAPTVVEMTMFDIHYFEYEENDYDKDWRRSILEKWPAADLKVSRVTNVVFKTLVVPPRPNAGIGAIKCNKPEDYMTQTGRPFDGEQATALQWKDALQAAGGQTRLRLIFVNIYNVHAGGQAWNYGGVGRVGRTGLMHHELGHALGVLHLMDEPDYPYVDAMYGIECGGPHLGPQWGFDSRIGLPGAESGKARFVSPIVQAGAEQGKVGEWKHDPMQGGMQDMDPGLLLRMFSDFSTHKMQAYLENHVAIWDDKVKSYVTWDDAAKKYAKPLVSDGVHVPVEAEVEVYSVMAAISAINTNANLIYPPIGPYTSGLIRLFDPSVAADRERAAEVFAPEHGCDVSLRIVQGGKTKTYMLPASWKPDEDPIQTHNFATRAVNVPVRDGTVTKVELLLTPDAEKNGLPNTPKVLDTWTAAE